MAFSLTDFIAPIGNLLGGVLGADSAMDRQQQAQEFSAQQFATRYQTTVKDMQAAGLNPMLAYSQGGGNAPTSSAAAASSYGDFGTSYVQSKLASAQEANVRADTTNKNAQTANIDADTALKRAQTYLTTAQEGLAGASSDQARANVNYLETQAKKISEEIKNVPKEGDRLDALVKNLGQEYKLLLEKTHNVSQATEQLKWLAVKTMLESDLTGFDVKAAQDLGNLGRYSKEGKVALDIIREFRRK